MDRSLSIDDVDLEHAPFPLVDVCDRHGDQGVGFGGEVEVVVRALDEPQLGVGVVVVGVPAAAVGFVAGPDPADVVGFGVDV